MEVLTQNLQCSVGGKLMDFRMKEINILHQGKDW